MAALEHTSKKIQANTERFSWRDIIDLLETAATTIFVILMLFTFVLRPATVDGSSMKPTLYHGDKLLMVSLFYEPQPGDIVIINDIEAGYFTDAAQTQVAHKAGMGIVLVKRVIATGGQMLDIDFDTGAVTVDGVLQDEPYIAAPTTRNDGAFTYPLTVPEGYVFVMGDNRQNSTDSRSSNVALVPEEQVMGQVILRYGRNEELCMSWSDRFGVLS